MILAAQTIGIVASHIQVVAVHRIFTKSILMPPNRILGNLFEAGALDRGCCAGKILLHKGAGETNSVKDLRAAVGLEGGDAHF